MKKLFLALALLSPFANTAQADTVPVTLPSGYSARADFVNSGGGLSYLPDGDYLAFSSIDYSTSPATGPVLRLVDGNGDGRPATPLELIRFDTNSFPSFAQASPDGRYALIGVSGSSLAEDAIYLINLSNGKTRLLLNAPGNFDFAFKDNSSGYLSSNPDGFSKFPPENTLSYLELSEENVKNFAPVANFVDTYSGPLTVDPAGDLLYIKGTSVYPPPAGSYTLFRLSASALATALATATPLTESEVTKIASLDGGYDLVHMPEANFQGFVFFSSVTTESDKIQRLNLDTLVLDPFMSLADARFFANTQLAVLRPASGFNPEAPARAALGVTITDYSSNNAALQILPDSFDTDGDGKRDAEDLCKFDPLKIAPQVCGCGTKEDTNADGVADCGLPRGFAKAIIPQAGFLVGRTLVVEALQGTNLRYTFEVRGPAKSRRARIFNSKSNQLSLSKLKAGTYRFRFRVWQKVGRRTVRSNWSNWSEIVLN